MGGVTRTTARFAVDRSMGEAAVFADVFMTLKTEVIAGTGQESFMVRGMRVMAGEALALLERGMLNRAAPFHRILIVAVEAELFRGVLQSKRILARGRQMAGIALRLGHRAVQTPPQQLQTL